jgi:ABC-type multidrug transport system ATPase subunit
MEVYIMHKHELSLYAETGPFNLGFVGGEYHLEELRSSLSDETREKIKDLLKKIRDEYGKKIKLSTHDPRNLTSIPADIKHHIKSSQPTWILDGKKLFEGVPEWEELKKEIDKVTQ